MSYLTEVERQRRVWWLVREFAQAGVEQVTMQNLAHLACFCEATGTRIGLSLRPSTTGGSTGGLARPQIGRGVPAGR